MKSQCANDELSQQKGSIKEKLPGVPIRFVSTEGFTPNWCAVAVPQVSSGSGKTPGFSGLSPSNFRAGWLSASH
jgi:hypothetical protein